MKIKILVGLIWFLVPSMAFSETIYVDNELTANCLNGNYSLSKGNCSGSDGDAYDTIQEAIDYVANSGRMGKEAFTIRVTDGTYLLPDPIDNYNLKSGIDVRRLVGTSQHPITLRAHNIAWPPKVILRWNVNKITDWNDNPVLVNGGQGTDHSKYANHFILDGFELIGRGRDLNNDGIGNASSDGVAPRTFTVRNCKIHDFKYGGIRGGYTWIVEYNEIYNIGKTLNHHCIYINKNGSKNNNSIIRYNLFHDVRGWGVLPYDSWAGDHPNGLQMYGNIVWNVGSNLGGGGGLNISGDNYKVYNNTIFNSRFGIRIQGGADNADVRNNAVFQSQYASIYFENNPTNATVKYNLVFNNGTERGNSTDGKCSNCTVSNNITNQSPNFVGVDGSEYNLISFPKGIKWTDFMLNSNSPLINSGTNLGGSMDDVFSSSDTIWPPYMVDQDNYGGSWEIGAFASDGTGGQSSAPKPPTGLSIVE
jgi:parallel beta-helix repeat protein